MQDFSRPLRAALRLALGAFSIMVAVLPASFARADELQEATRLFQAGQRPQALARVNKILEKKPSDPRAEFLKGLILTEEGDAKQATAIFLKLTREHPELPEPYNNLAVIYASQGHYEKARKALEQSIRTHPSYATAYENLGDVYAKLASQAYDRALRLDSNNSGAQNKLALVRELEGSVPRARTGAATPVAQSEAATPVTQSDAATPVTQSEAATPASEGGAAKPVAASKGPTAVAAITPAATPIPVAPAAAPRPATAKPAPAAPTPARVVPAPARVAPNPARLAAAAPPGPRASGPIRAADPTRDIAATLKAWASAWSHRDVDKYLSFYDSHFVTPHGQPRAQWEAARRLRLTAPKSISVSIAKPRISLPKGDLATVTFRQSYKSNLFTGRSTKTLVMVRVEGRWLIRKEEASR